MTTATTVAGLESLGACYDVFDKYADPESTGRQVIDFGTGLVHQNVGGRVVEVPSLVQLVPLSGSQLTTASGSSITAFESSFAQDAGLTGSYGFFSASVSESFTKDVASSDEYYFWRISEVVTVWKLALPPIAELQAHLAPDFADALANDDPATLFASYDPYFVQNCIVGGSATGTAYCTKNSMSDVEAVTATVQAGFAAATGYAGASNASAVQTMVSDFNLTITTSGGDPGTNLAPGDTSGFEAWAATVAKSPVIVQFEQDSLVGIWELSPDPERRQVLQAYFTTSILPKHPALAPDTTAALAGRWETMTPLQRTWDDEGSGADMNGDFYVPPPADGWYAVGAYAQGGNHSYAYGSPVEYPALLVQATDPTALSDPVGWTAVWSAENLSWDVGGTAEPARFTFWEANPPADYVALGTWITVEVGVSSAPVAPAAGQFKCVRSDLVDNASYGGLIWWDKDSGHKGDVALYAVAVGDDAVDAHTFATLPNYGGPTPNSPQRFCLKSESIDIATS